MARKFPEHKQLNLPNIGEEILQYWKENQIFEKSISSRQGKPAFTFYEGPPSANGMPGIHHVMGRAIKDIFCRFKTLQGFQVERKAGWDTHGLPVELGVEKELGITKEDIGKSISVEEYNAACKKAVMRYTDVWNDLTEKMGYWVDMDDPYVTYKPKYMETVWWLLKQLWDKQLIYKGYTIQPYSPKAGTGLSSHEINMPGSYRDVTDTTIVAQFRLKNHLPQSILNVFEGLIELRKQKVQSTDEVILVSLQKALERISERQVYFLAWTTTPWTLPSNTALTVNPKIKYCFVAATNKYTGEQQIVVLAKNLFQKHFDINGVNLEDITTGTYSSIPHSSSKNGHWQYLFEVLGSDLVGIKYEQLLPYAKPYENAENAFQIIPGDFVTTEDGTGIVHTAPTFGADDAKVAKDAGVPPMLVLDENDNPVPLVDLQGRFTKDMGEHAGKYVKNEYYTDGEAPEKSVDVEIAIKLKEENKAFKVEKYVHSYPHCWRTDKPVLYYPLDSWFVKVSEHKERLVALNKTINWKPKATGEGRFGNWLENANDWNLSRSRYWGIPLPIWSTEDGAERQIFGSVAELKEACDKALEAGLMTSHPFESFEAGNLSDANYDQIDLHRNIVDKIVLQSPSGKPMQRESDLIDVWFDSGAMPYAQQHYPFENEDKFRAPSAPEGGTEQNPRWQTANPAIYETLKERSKELRKNETETEKILWAELQNKKLGNIKFRRQHIIDQYIVDFVCISKKLIIELDGKYHLTAEQKKADQLRTEKLSDLGFSVLRFTNDEVLKDLKKVTDTIFETLQKAPLGGLGAPARFPADFIAEGVDQTRGWFYTLHTIAGLVFDSVAYKNVVSNGLVLDKNGQKMSKRLGNAANPFETINKYGVDAVRWYMISNAQPWDNLKFDVDGITEVQRKFFGTLYNTYGFFSMYANIDGFEWKDDALTKVSERPELDRWILSRVQVLRQTVEKSFEEYEPTRAARAVQEFVDEELSNWYVRLCRRRFWKGEMSLDKQMAYETLYQCLMDIAQLMSPVAPFFADWLYQNLSSHLPKGKKLDSIHLTELSPVQENLIDERLNDRMKMAQQLSSMVFSLRKRENLKVRQPLQKMMVPALKSDTVSLIESIKHIVLAEVNVKELEVLEDVSGILTKKLKADFKKLGPRFGKMMKQLAGAIAQMDQAAIGQLEADGKYNLDIEGNTAEITLNDVEIITEDIPGWLVLSEGGLTVALDINLSEDLTNEGIARELINRIQNLRKESGLEVTDRINLAVQKAQGVDAAVQQFGAYISEETLANQLQITDQLPNGSEVQFDEIETRIWLERV